MYEVVFDKEFINFLNKLQRPVRDRIFNKILSTKENPLRFFERLTERNDYKLRVGDYRIIADINQNLKKIEITRVGHRKNIYERL